MSSIRQNNRGTIYIAGGAPMHIVEPDQTPMAVYRQATLLGITAGLRSMMPGALLAWSSDSATQKTKDILAILAIGEIIGDKLPFTPGRLQKGSLTGRLVAGAVSGAILCRRHQLPVIQGAWRGAVGAALGSVAGYSYRLVTSDLTGVSDLVWALLEDGTAFLLGANATGLIQPVDAATQS
jgi:uncharacterized membrane protein